jgi:hypothetical protein
MKEAGKIAGLFYFAAFCSARRLSAVHQTNFTEPEKPRNITQLLSLSGGQLQTREEKFQ